ncbi:MAG: phosphohydrolase, partial [Candidatus Pacebacteria bacterium]|nr:phosphohydrolase [Candidatus Paceibacterota bacterium]
SFSKGITPDLIEAKGLQDADRLEATGAISIMRTFASSGQMNRPFYSPEDPFCENGHTDFRSGIDLFYRRLLIVEKTMHTELAKKMARKRTQFLEKFLEQFREELVDSGIISK